MGWAHPVRATAASPSLSGTILADPWSCREVGRDVRARMEKGSESRNVTPLAGLDPGPSPLDDRWGVVEHEWLQAPMTTGVKAAAGATSPGPSGVRRLGPKAGAAAVTGCTSARPSVRTFGRVGPSGGPGAETPREPWLEGRTLNPRRPYG